MRHARRNDSRMTTLARRIARVTLGPKRLFLLPHAYEVAASRRRVRDEHVTAERTGQQDGSHASLSRVPFTLEPATPRPAMRRQERRADPARREPAVAA